MTADRRRNLLVACGLVALALAIYAQAAGFDFVLTDDGVYVRDNPHVTSGLTRAGAVWAFTTFEASNWHPLTWLSLMLDAQLGGKGPRVYHATNILLHVANSVLLYFLFLSLTRVRWRSALVAAVFAVHPLHVESVAWVAERKDVLCAFFGLLTVMAYVGYARRPGRARYAGVVVLFAMGLMAKPMLVTLPLVLLLLDFWPLGRWRARECVVEKLPLFILSFASCAVTLWAQWRVVGNREAFPLVARVANAAIGYLWYLGKTLWPVDLALHYPYDPDPSALVAGLALALLALITAFAIRGAVSRPYLFVGWLWYLVMLVPVIGIVQVGVQSVADRYAYLPSIGLYIVVAFWQIEGSREWRWVARLVLPAILVLLAIRAHRQVAIWENSERLFSHALDVDEGNVLAHNGLAFVLAAEGRVAEAMGHYADSLRIDPSDRFARTALAALAVRGGDLDRAAALYREELTRFPLAAETRWRLASVLAGLGRDAEAAAEFAIARSAGVADADSLANYGIVLERLRRDGEAIEQLEAALALDPRSALAHRALAGVFGRTGRLEDAVTHLELALATDPDDRGARLNLAIYLTRLGELDRAEQVLLSIVARDPKDATAHKRLGVVYFEQRRAGDAIRAFEESLRLDPGQADLRQDVERLKTLARRRKGD